MPDQGFCLTPPLAPIRLEPGSFRDRTNRVFYQADSVFRGLSEHARKEWDILSSTAFFPRLMAEGKVVHTEQIETSSIPDLDQAGQWAAILQHQALPFISYPYEWTFGMLKDAALLQLELIQAALGENMILKDASPFNIQWVGTRPVFIDIASFEQLVPGEPWVGYQQFCQQFLYPLFLQAYKDIPFQPWLRGSLDGIEPEQCAHLMSLRDLLRPGVFTHVYLQAKAQSSYAPTSRNLKQDLRAAGFHKALIQANVNRLHKTIQKLTWKRTASTWSDYENNTSYTDTARRQKVDFVRRVTQSQFWPLVWDLGCNIGTFSRIAAKNARNVIAMDVDPLVIERLYQALKAENSVSILPLVSNVVDPSPNLGWRGLERRALTARGRPDLILCLALIHHLVIGANLPLKELLEWLASIGSSLVIEFITPEDPMVRTLLRRKANHYDDYNTAYFERCLSEAYDIVRQETLSSGTRILYHAKSKM